MRWCRMSASAELPGIRFIARDLVVVFVVVFLIRKSSCTAFHLGEKVREREMGG